ncbi:MAG TPA: 30S ribosomal protein S16 [bacterium]|nr:30S ribosomal protein S16 [bacterium]
MSTRIRLKRKGRRKQSHFRIVVVDKRRPRDGSVIEDIGYYNPLTEPAEIKIDHEKALEWLKKGAQPSDTVHNIMQKEGIALQHHLDKNYTDEEAKNIERQKWELSKKARAEKEESAKIEEDQKEVVTEETQEETEESGVGEPGQEEEKPEEEKEEKKPEPKEEKSTEKEESSDEESDQDEEDQEKLKEDAEK